MQLKIQRYLYYQAKELVEQRTERQYLIRHGFEIFAYSIYIIRGLLAIISYASESETFQYWRQDPWVYYIFENYHKAFVFYTSIMIAPFIYGACCTVAYSFHRVNLMTFRVIYDLIVLNIDQIKDCQFSKNKQMEILNQNYKISLIKLKQIPIIWHIPLIRLVLTIFCWYWNKIQLEFSSQMIDRKKISTYKLKTISVSFELRQKLAYFVSLLDNLFYFFHIIIGKCLIELKILIQF